jgi:hypothetical protein
MKFRNNHLLMLFVFLNFFISCKKSRPDNEKMLYSIDLSVQQKKSISTFKIEPDGKVTVLINKMYEINNVYQVQFSEQEMSSIKKKLDEISLTKCDTINKTYVDGMRYILVLDDREKKTTLISDTCEQLKPLDDLVLYILNLYNKKEKTLFYESLKIITPPSPPAPRGVH